ncbi:MAG: hypothetical protein FD174_1341 [Geobacteraceae bacterium]|nr:MAG: hypothetical protein FD174_1341 [Geobacteraceae bacterium]
MKKSARKILSGVLLMGLCMPISALAADQDIQQKVDTLQKEIDALKQQVGKVEEKSLGRWLTIGGDYRFRYDYLRGKVPGYTQFVPDFTNPANSQFIPVDGQTVKNTSLYTNRFGLDLKAKATKDVTVTTRLLMYKISGAQDDAAIQGSASGNPQIGAGPFFADRAGVFDGTLGHVPTDNKLLVDQVFATWSNIAEQPVWFSIGRRPSTGGVPTHLRQNTQPRGNSGVPALLVDYAFDGATLGYAPDIEALPGAYTKLCYGIGFENGITGDAGNGLRDTHMVGLNLVPYDTDQLRAEFQWNRGINIFDSPQILTGQAAALGFKPRNEVGDIDWYGLDFIGKLKKIGIGDLNWFVDGALSVTHPNGATNALGGGLLFNAGQPADDKTGWAIFVGGRYDIEATGTKLGFEYNHGSKDWITFAPAADDIWTSKVGTRGSVYEGYIIQELKLKPISSYLSKTFFKVGYQYYDFDYTGSNNWVGAPVKIAELNKPANAQFFTPLENAQDLYVTFEVKF